MSALEPGLYKATVRGVADVVVFVTENSLGYTMTSVGDATMHSPSRDFADARPLIVLDLDDPRGAVAQIRSYYAHRDDIPAYMEEVADQIESQTKPAPRPHPTPLALVALIRGAGTSEQGEKMLEMWLAQDNLIRDGVA